MRKTALLCLLLATLAGCASGQHYSYNTNGSWSPGASEPDVRF